MTKLSKKGKVILFSSLGAVVIAAVVLLFIFQPFSAERRYASELNQSISRTQNLDDLMLVSNLGFTFNQNGKANKTVTQGVCVSQSKGENVLLKGDIHFTSEINPSNDFDTNFDVLKMGDTVTEKQGNKYVPSDITEKEFKKIHEDFRIYNFRYSEVKEIRRSESVDKTKYIYEVLLDKIPQDMQKNYIETINQATGEAFTAKDLKCNSVTVVSTVSKGILRSQQLRISVEAKSKINLVSIGFISEINITDDQQAIQQQFN